MPRRRVVVLCVVCAALEASPTRVSTDAFRAAIDRGWWSYAAQLVAASDDDGEGVDAALYEQLAAAVNEAQRSVKGRVDATLDSLQHGRSAAAEPIITQTRHERVISFIQI